jgi:Melibiase/Glycosyl hydrolase family 36 C-terminal domain
MGNRLQRRLALLMALLAPSIVAAQITASLETADTQLQFEAGANAPKLSTLRHGQAVWTNRASEDLIASAELGGKLIPVYWSFNASESRVEKKLVRFVYDSTSPHLRLVWEWEVRSERGLSEPGPIEHQIRIENREAGEIWLPLQESFAFDWQIAQDDKLEQFYVEKGADTPSDAGTHRVPVKDEYAWEGKSSTYAQPRPGEAREIIPYFMVSRDDAARSGWYVGIEFSGRVRLTLARKGGSLSGKVGLNPNPGPFRMRLGPGATFETPRIFFGASSGDPDESGNVLHRWVREVLANPAAWNDPHYPLVVNNSWGGGMAINEDIAKRMIRDSGDLGFEMFHMDAGWFRGVGDWRPDPKKFPHGINPIVDEVHAKGMKFGLWVDWAQAGLGTAAGALNARDPEVRTWLTNDLPENWKPEEFKGQTIDIGVPAAKAWAMRETNRIVGDYKLDMLEHDGYLVAKGCGASDHPHAPPDPLNQCTYRDSGFVFVESSNSTDVSYHAVRAYYDIQSELRRKHPGLLLEVCNDGGRMVDFGSAAHGDYFSITDTYDPLSNRRGFYDASFVLPPAMLETYVERWPAPKIENFRYMLRSGMMGWLSVMIDTNSWDAEQHKAAKEEIELYKLHLRPLIREADLYHISERPDGVHWDGIEYFDDKNRVGVVYAFRGSTENEASHKFILRGLSAASHYRLHFQDHSSDDRVAAGRQLMDQGFEVHLTLPNSSEIVFVEEIRTTQVSSK